MGWRATGKGVWPGCHSHAQETRLLFKEFSWQNWAKEGGEDLGAWLLEQVSPEAPPGAASGLTAVWTKEPETRKLSKGYTEVRNSDGQRGSGFTSAFKWRWPGWGQGLDHWNLAEGSWTMNSSLLLLMILQNKLHHTCTQAWSVFKKLYHGSVIFS